MKIAICLSGQLRSYKNTFASFERFFSIHSPDVFLVTARTTPEEQDHVMSLFKPRRALFLDDIAVGKHVQRRQQETRQTSAMYVPGEFERERILGSFRSFCTEGRFLTIEEPHSIEPARGSRKNHEAVLSKFVKLPLSLNGGVSEAALFQFYRCEEAARLCEEYCRETNTEYDVVIRTRFDVEHYHGDRDRFFTPEALSTDEIFALSSHASRITYLMNDFFFYGSPAVMFAFQKMFSDIVPILQYMACNKLAVPAHGYQESMYWGQLARLNLRVREAGTSPNLVHTPIVRG